jgi:hypothetical protein
MVRLVRFAGGVKGVNNLRRHDIKGSFKQSQRSDKVSEH